MTRTRVVLHASAVVDYMTGGPYSPWIGNELSGMTLSAPAHLNGEVFSALGRQFRAGLVGEGAVDDALRAAASLDVAPHPVEGLLLGAWQRRHNVALADALYVELAAQLGTVVVTTDRRLARATPLAVAPPE
jgi:predicted nucleic acid-binding protein